MYNGWLAVVLIFFVCCIFSSGTGLNQRPSSPFDVSYVNRGGSFSTIEVHHNAPDDIEMQEMEHPPTDHHLRRKSSHWQRLKQRLNSSTSDHEREDPIVPISAVLPDDVEYIEGGDLVARDSHELLTSYSGQEATSSDHDMHSLSPVFEDKSEDGGRGTSGSVRKSNESTNAINTNGTTTKDGTENGLAPVSDENSKL